MTYQAISDALNIPLKLNSEALKYIKEKYDFAQKAGIIKDGSLNKYRKKMAYVPETSKILYNPVGAAPGAVIEYKDTQIICLPGVPAELKSIFRKKVAKLIQQKIGDLIFVENSIFSTGFIESEITHIVDKVMEEVNLALKDNSQVSLTTKSPQIWIKTLVKAPYKKIIIEFHVSCLGPAEIANKNVEKAIELLRKYIDKEGGVCYMEDEI
jgi:molybdopterin-biosynthesis enzyme MoeA-like protein